MKKYRGITLVETVVTIAIMSIVMLGSSLFFVRMWEINSFTYEIGLASFIASRGIDSAAHDIRKARPAENGAFPIVFADDDDIIFYMDYDYDGDAERMHYFVEDQKFKIGIREPDMNVVPPTYASGDGTVENAATFIVNEANGYPTFEYYDEDGAIYSYDDLEDEALATPADPSAIRMVKILLFVNPDPIKKPNNVRLQSVVVIRNLTDFDKVPT